MARSKTIQQFLAAKAFIVYNGTVLILRESAEYADGTNPGKYDVAGGRILPGQPVDETLIREIKEETGLTVTVGRPFAVSEWHPEIQEKPSQIIGVFFECFADTNEVVLSKDHDSYAWIDPASYDNFEIIPGLKKVFETYTTR